MQEDIAYGVDRRHFMAAGLGAAALLASPKLLRAAGTGERIRALAFDGDTLLAAGEKLMLGGDVGRVWTPGRTPGRILALATHRERPGRVLAGLEEAAALSEDGGANWRILSGGLPAGGVGALAVAAGNPDMFYAAVHGDGVWKSEDAGASWSFVMDRPWLDEAEHDPLTLASVDLATGMGGIWIYAGTEAGLTRVPDCFCRWQAVRPGDAMDALAAGRQPPAQAPLPGGEPVLSLASAPSEPTTLYAALPSGIWTSRDAGVVWEQTAAGAAAAVAVHPDDPQHVAAVRGGTLNLSRDGGTNWAAVAAA